jgi:photosystem II stability/assembly factor-like uncharacterized protein
MKKLFLVLVIMFVQKTTIAQWIEQPTPSPIFNLFSFSFPSVNTGFAVGYGNRMIKTTNSGNNWFNISIFSNTAQDLNSVWFNNENTGWMCSTNDTLYHTTNSALTWNRQMKLQSDGQKIFFIDSNTGWILAQPRLYKTTDAGLNWAVVNTQMGQYFTFSSANTGWMASYPGGGSIIHKTTDGGSTWAAQYSTSDFRVIYSLEFIDDNTGWAAGYREHILKTTNGGVNWIQQRDMGNSTPLVSMDFIDNNTGWVTGGSGYSLYTLNGGTTWNQINLSAGSPKVKFLNSKTGWIIGSKVYKTTTTGLVYKSLQLNVLIEGFYDAIPNSMVSDTAVVYLRSSVSPYSKIDSAKSLVNSNGVGTFDFVNANNNVNYYIAVKHRNSVETWSSTAQSFVANSLNYDMATSQSQAFGNNLRQVNSAPVRFAIFGGDVDQDGTVDASDLSEIDNDAYYFASGYVDSDLNGDDFVDASDFAIADNNATKFISKVTP